MKLEIEIDACDLVQLANISADTELGICEVAQGLLLDRLYDKEFDFKFTVKMIPISEFVAHSVFHTWIMEEIKNDFELGLFNDSSALIGVISPNSLVVASKKGICEYTYDSVKGVCRE